MRRLVNIAEVVDEASRRISALEEGDGVLMLVTANGDHHLTFVPEHWTRSDLAHALAVLARDCADTAELSRPHAGGRKRVWKASDMSMQRN